MQTDRFSVAWLMLIVTGSAFYAWITRLAFNGSPLATLISGAILVAVVPFIFYGLAFLIAYPFGVLNEILGKGIEKSQSPFAEDRLPSQQVAPSSDPEKAH